MADLPFGLDLEKEEEDAASQAPRRPHCAQCGRPTASCYCRALPTERLSLFRDCPCISCIIIYQHPNEDKRTFKSAVVFGRCCTASRSFSSVDELNTYLATHGPHELDIAYIRTRKVCCCNLNLFSALQLPENHHHGLPDGVPRPILIYSTPESRPLSTLLQSPVQPTSQTAALSEPPPPSTASYPGFPPTTSEATPSVVTGPPPIPSAPSANDGFPSPPYTNGPFLLVVLDGTWKETSEMYAASSWLKNVPAYHLSPSVFKTCAAWDGTAPSFGLFGEVRVPPSLNSGTTRRGRRGRRAARKLVCEQLNEMSMSGPSALSSLISDSGFRSARTANEEHPPAERAGTRDLAPQPVVSPILCTAEAVAVSVETLARHFASDGSRPSHVSIALSITRDIKRVLESIAAFQKGKRAQSELQAASS